jgi:magnesium chelatase family protein
VLLAFPEKLLCSEGSRVFRSRENRTLWVLERPYSRVSLLADPNSALRRKDLGPLLDRIDIHIDAPAVKFRELRGETTPETDSSATIRQRVLKARERQQRRFAGEKIFSNATMTPRMIRTYCRIDTNGEKLLENAMRRQGLSARAYDRVLKVSRTIADLEGSEAITSNHVSEAVGYRSLDRTYWT